MCWYKTYNFEGINYLPPCSFPSHLLKEIDLHNQACINTRQIILHVVASLSDLVSKLPKAQFVDFKCANTPN